LRSLRVSGDGSYEVELNEQQLDVVEAAADARMLVIAGAGQGKTEVVVSRINGLVQDEGLTASEEILVLSFSRAAVSAVRTRLDTRDVAAANVRTFDSFASVLLLGADIQPEGSFDARIRRATQLLREADEAPHEVLLLRHVVLDEVQDLVGDRADFVIAILKWLDDDAGITALGDPLQGVYDFQLADSVSKTSAKDVFDELTDSFGCQTVGLGRNYRARGKFPKRVVALGDALRAADDGDSAEQLLVDLMLDVPYRGEIADWYDIVTPNTGRTAVLCTTNAEVLRVSRYLNEKSVAHAVRRQAQDFGAARWIAGALGPPARSEGKTIRGRSRARKIAHRSRRRADVERAESRRRTYQPA
jgi:DNA helicase-2/ATP-dependent DNA helicase PcrA